MLVLKRTLVLLVGLLLVWAAYRWAYSATRHPSSIVIGVLALYLLTAYLVLPRIHRFLTKFYVPQFFDGRSRTADGLLSDPVNIAFIGSRLQLERAMYDSGWVNGDLLNPNSARKVIYNVLFNRSYPKTPAGAQFLFGRRQDYSFQKEIGKSARRRHHMRVWEAPPEYRLPDGTRVDWLASAHRDITIRLSYFTLQFMHRINPDLNMERDFVAEYLKKNGHTQKVAMYKHFTTAYRHYTGDGFTFHTDGNLAIITLNQFIKK